MKRMKLLVDERREIEVDVEFPIYRKQITGDFCTTYSRESEDGKQITIRAFNDFEVRSYEVEFMRGCLTRRDGSGLDYLLGSGLYKCAPHEWKEVVERLRANAEKIPL